MRDAADAAKDPAKAVSRKEEKCIALTRDYYKRNKNWDNVVMTGKESV